MKLKPIKESNVVTDLLLQAAMNNIDGARTDIVVGLLPSISGVDIEEDIWSGGGTYQFYPTTAQPLEIYSDNVADITEATVFGLDENWLEQEEAVILNGATPVNLTKAFIRVNRVIMKKEATNKGTITLRVQGGGTIAAIISPLNGITMSGNFSTPADKYTFILKFVRSLANKKKATLRVCLWVRDFGEDWYLQDVEGVHFDGDSSPSEDFFVPVLISPKTDLKACVNSNLTGAAATAKYQLLYVQK